MPNRSDDSPKPLDGLTAGEREVLILLAHGHTAKTIATSLGLSVAAVNERLRGARRRTGAGSSRELARMVVQQNRDDFSGLAATDGPASGSGAAAPTGRWNNGRHLMLATAALATALALSLAPQLAGQPQQASPDRTGADSDLLARLSSAPNPQQLRDQLRAEPRDDAWAPGIEAGIRERYGRTPIAARSLDSLSVACGATLCEVIGRTRPGATSDEITTVLGEVQSGELNASIEELGLRILSSSFTADAGDPQSMAFVAYLEREGRQVDRFS